VNNGRLLLHLGTTHSITFPLAEIGNTSRMPAPTNPMKQRDQRTRLPCPGRVATRLAALLWPPHRRTATNLGAAQAHPRSPGRTQPNPVNRSTRRQSDMPQHGTIQELRRVFNKISACERVALPNIYRLTCQKSCPSTPHCAPSHTRVNVGTKVPRTEDVALRRKP
jgi:hypothetical protein